MTASGPFWALVGRCRSLVETVSPFSRTAPTLEVVAPLSVPMKMFWAACIRKRSSVDTGLARRRQTAFVTTAIMELFLHLTAEGRLLRWRQAWRPHCAWFVN